MKAPPIPEFEAQRLATLRRLEILDSLPEERYDRLTRLARDLFQVPIALVSLVDQDRQWFKSRQGLEAGETSRDSSFCAHAIAIPETLHVPNALEDERFAGNPLVLGPPNIRFYAGVPVCVRDQPIGTLCVIDSKPRELDEDGLRKLRDLAAVVETELNRQELEELVRLVGEGEERLRLLFDTVPDGIFAIEADGRIGRTNPAMESLFPGRTRGLRGLLAEELFPEIPRLWERALEEPGGSWEHRIVGHAARADGSPFPVELTLTGARFDGERNWVGVVRDLSEKHRADAALEAAEARWRRAVAGTHDGLWERDLRQGSCWVSNRFKGLLGYPDDVGDQEIGGIFDRIHPDDQPGTEVAMEAHLEEGAQFEIDHRLRTRGGDWRWFHTRGQAERDETGEPLRMSGSSMDIQGRKEVEKELIVAKEEAEESNVLKSEFLNLMSHELRTPMTVVLGYLPLLADPDALPPPEVISEIAADMNVAGDHLLALINDLLDLSKIEAGKMELCLESVDLGMLAAEVAGSLRQKAAARGLEIEVEVAEGSTIVTGDRLRLRQVLINLIGNAIKFTEEGAVRISASRSGADVEVSVADTGIGIAEEDLESVFENFRQVDSSSTRKAHGTGLGLAITRNLVELHEGTIRARSRPREGSVFTVHLPAEGSSGSEDTERCGTSAEVPQ